MADKQSSDLGKIFDYPGARDAFNKLLSHNCDPEKLNLSLSFLKSSGIRGKTERLSPRRRQRQAASRKVKALAREIRELIHYRDISRKLQASISEDSNKDLFRWRHLHRLPENLEDLARILERDRPKGSPNWVPGERNHPIYAFLNCIKAATGSFHYEEAATLVNAVDNAISPRREKERWSATNLAQLVSRRNKITCDSKRSGPNGDKNSQAKRGTKKIIIDIDGTGQMCIEYEGFVGNECFQVADSLQVALAQRGIEVEVIEVSRTPSCGATQFDQS